VAKIIGKGGRTYLLFGEKGVRRQAQRLLLRVEKRKADHRRGTKMRKGKGERECLFIVPHPWEEVTLLSNV